MADLDLIPADYQRGLALRRRLTRFGVLYAVLVLALVLAKLTLVVGVRAKVEAVEELQAAKVLEQDQQSQLAALEIETSDAERRLQILAGLRGGVDAKRMFAVIDRASDGGVWFDRWSFRRAGELVDSDPQAVRTGYFIVLPREPRRDKQDERDKGWLMRTHMEIHAQAIDHSTLARFARRLIEQPEIEEVRVLNTRSRPSDRSEIIDFELAVVVRTEA